MLLARTVVNKHIWISLALLFPVTLAANTSNEIPLPDRTEARWVAVDNLHNGYPLAVKQFTSGLSVDTVMAFYRRLWETPESDVPGYQENKSHGWSMISRLLDSHQWVVQVKPKRAGGGSEGYLSKMPIRHFHEPSINTSVSFAQPPLGGKEISRTRSHEPTNAQTQIIVYSGRPSQVARRLSHHFNRTGWSTQDQFEHKQAIAFRFQNTHRWLDASIVSVNSSQSLVLLNEVIRDD